MSKCLVCEQNLRGRNSSKDHYERFHNPPQYNEDGSIQINAVHQVTLILKGEKTWKQVIREESVRSRKFKRVDESAFRSIEQLMKFEQDNNIEFNYNEDKFSITKIIKCENDLK